MPMSGDFLRFKREREDPLNAGIRKALNGESPHQDQSTQPEEWSPEKIKAAQREVERQEAEYESGAWPMSHRP